MDKRKEDSSSIKGSITAINIDLPLESLDEGSEDE
jgi:hypothetical protein